MKKPAIYLCTILALSVAAGFMAKADESNGLGEVRTFRHMNQQDIVTGVVTFDQCFEHGKLLFAAPLNRLDGQGRPATTGGGAKRIADQPEFIRTSAPDASSCAGCHGQPRVGGGGDFVANVFVLAQTLDPVTFSVAPEFSNERNTLGMFGSGPIEALAREMTGDLLAIRDAALAAAAAGGSDVTMSLDTKGVNFGSITARPDGTLDTGGVDGVDANLIIKPFHQKGAVISLREFTNNAFNHHHGMQSVERFGVDRTGEADFDEDGVEDEMSIGDITAATLFQAALGTPGRVISNDPARRQAIADGESLFGEIGCTDCHKSSLVLENRIFCEPNPYNPPGNFKDTGESTCFDMTKDGEKPRIERHGKGGAVVRAFTDLKRHNLCDDEIDHFCNEQVVQAGIPTEEFLTRKLWDVGNSAPYGHRGDLTTLTEAIDMHGGEARSQRDAYFDLSQYERDAIIEFLKSMQVLPEGTPRLVVEK